jgi:hypothetical protein
MPEEGKSLSQKWQEYRPSKAVWGWSCVGAVVLTMVLGFTAGGWVTGGSAQAMAESAARDARQSLVASLCVEKFVSAPDAASNLAELKETSSWDQDNFVTDGGWATIEGLDSQIPNVANVCADRLVAMEGLPENAVSPDSGAAEG